MTADVSASTSTVQVFINGQQISSSGSTQGELANAIDQSSLEDLIKAMSVWSAGNAGESGPGHDPGSNLECVAAIVAVDSW